MTQTIRKVLFVFILMSVSHGKVESQQAFSLDNLSWLTGTWKKERTQKATFETWIKVSARTFEGESFTVTAQDTVHLEYLRIERFGDDIFYTAKVGHNKYPVPFKLEKVDENGFVFENAEHDFPQRIIYRRKEDGTLHVRIEGERKGENTGVDFYFTKVK